MPASTSRRCIRPARRPRPTTGPSTPSSRPAEACHKGGHPFGIGLGTTADNVDTAGAIFHGFGAMLVDAKGDITVKSDAVRQALDYYKKLMAFLPPDVPAWDDASNNKWLVSGKGALIMNPPSAWAVAKRDAPQVAEQCWTHGFPAGPKGRFAPFVPFFWGTWNFSKNQSAAKSLIVHLSQASSAEKMVIAASGGYDLPSFANLTTFKTWAEEGPPKGTLYHYPNPYNHQILSIAGAPAPHKIAEQIYTSRASRPRWRSATSRARRWKRRSTGRPANSKASCATEARGGRTKGRRSGGVLAVPKHRLKRTEFVMADIAAPAAQAHHGRRRSSLHKLMQRKSTIAFLMALPLILLITCSWPIRRAMPSIWRRSTRA